MKPSRVRWDQLPDSVHHRVAEILGSPVSVDHVQTHGTTPGVASRVCLLYTSPSPRDS